ncbi:hypothetical protein LN840_004714 [Escherichia coli]|nr:hypothetical protein [Escherichia coli]
MANKIMKDMLDEILKEAIEARSKLKKRKGILVNNLRSPKSGLFLENYANCLLNRQLDIFDDSLFLLRNERFQSACIVSRGMVETHAFARFLNKKIEKILVNEQGKESAAKALDLVIKFTNSSRFKKEEQRKIKDGVFDPQDYMFTEQAKHRFENMLSFSQHVVEALKEMYQDEKEQAQRNESQFEMLYDVLSEYVHPSQTSIFHYYTPETHYIPTSMGTIHLYESAKQQCVQALHFIVDSKNLYKWSLDLAAEMTKRNEQ